MKNYYDTKRELEIRKLRLKLLYKRREALKSLVEPKSVVTDKIIIDPGTIEPDENISNYTHAKIPIDEEIENLEKEIEDLTSTLTGIEKELREHTGLDRRIFVMKYLDKLTSRRIACTVGYSKRHVDRILESIDKRINKKHVPKCPKLCDIIKK